jgi:hypothetical protein
MTGISVHDEVRVFDVNGKRMGQPEGGWPGRVVKVGRTLVYIEYRRGPAEAFRLADGGRNDKMGQRRFCTAEQAERDASKAAAVALLRAHGIDLNHRVKLTVAQVEELAGVVEKWGDPSCQ